MSIPAANLYSEMNSEQGLALQQLLNAQKESYQRMPNASLELRMERLTRLRKSLRKFQNQIADAICLDFGNRSKDETRMAEVMTCVETINYYIKHIGEWMKPSQRHVSPYHQPGKAWVQYQPLGVVGIMAPWNYPLALSVGPLICALAAGNHAMIKVSSASANFGKVLEAMLNDTFPPNVAAVVNGTGKINDIFCHLPFDLMVFTGSPNVGKTVMAAAAQNLVPVILELGGKSPVLVHPTADLEDLAQKLSFGKLWNAGQTCIAPDYVMLPRGRGHEFSQYMRQYIHKMYPTLRNNPDYTSIVNDKQYTRLQKYLADAKAKGAQVVEINPANEELAEVRKIAPTFVMQSTPDMLIAQEEIFGPILLVFEYDHMSDAIAYINKHPRPLAMYYFDKDMDRANDVAAKTHSGHFGINAILTHFVQEDLPFGGVGNSGMGKYHGHEGFLSMSHARSVMSQPKFWPTKMFLAPFKAHKGLAIKAVINVL